MLFFARLLLSLSSRDQLSLLINMMIGYRILRFGLILDWSISISERFDYEQSGMERVFLPGGSSMKNGAENALPTPGGGNGKSWQLSLYDQHRTPHEPITDGTEITVSPRSLNSELMCPICLDMLKNTMTTKECLHRFCQECITTALRSGNKECPTCRKKLISKRSLRPDPNFDALISKVSELEVIFGFYELWVGMILVASPNRTGYYVNLRFFSALSGSKRIRSNARTSVGQIEQALQHGSVAKEYRRRNEITSAAAKNASCHEHERVVDVSGWWNWWK